MNLTSLIIAIAIIVAIFLVLHFVMKAMKWIAAIAIIVIVLGVWFYGFSGFFDKVSDVKEKIPELEVQRIARSITGCTADEDCAYVVSSGDCRMVEEYCNNINKELKEENYFKVLEEDVLEEECNKTNMEIDSSIVCECRLHKEREGKIKQWVGEKIEEEAGYTYCWKKE